MNDFLSVAVIIPTRNRVARLVTTLRALRAQDYPDDHYEIIVVDDGSSDATREAVEGIRGKDSPPRITYLVSEGHGANAARNFGIQSSKAGLTCLIDDDVLPPPQWLRTLVDAAIHHGVELVWGPVFLPPELRLPGRHRSEVAPLLTESKTPQVPILCNMLVRRAVFQRGLFDPGWEGPVEEIEWVLRTEPSKMFVAEAWLWHNKSVDDCGLARLMKHAWKLGKVSGRFDRKRRRGGLGPLASALVGVIRSLGHALNARCSGGLLVAAGRAGYAVGYGLSSLGRIRPLPTAGGHGSLEA